LNNRAALEERRLRWQCAAERNTLEYQSRRNAKAHYPMTIQGTIQNGVVVLHGSPQLPDGTPVTVMIEKSQATTPIRQAQMSEEEHRRMIEILDRITAMPDENPGDTFSGADHDQALYGSP
jgi:hypothetical protein